MAYKKIITQLQRQSPVLMGILNVTPDSFSDGGSYARPQQAVRRAMEMIEAGASIIDIGGESSRPGAKPVSVAEELRRVVPVIQALRKKIDARPKTRAKNQAKKNIPHSHISPLVPPLISIDTYKPVIAAVALRLGADIVNDITGLRDPAMRQVVNQEKCPVILMHMLGDPQTMQSHPRYKNVVTDISRYFRDQIKLAEKSGIQPEQIILDPGIGFGKTVQHNFNILAGVSKFKQTFPQHLFLIGASRKSFIGALTGATTEDRLPGTLAAHLTAVKGGADILRVHDVIEHAQALQLHTALEQSCVQ